MDNYFNLEVGKVYDYSTRNHRGNILITELNVLNSIIVGVDIYLTCPPESYSTEENLGGIMQILYEQIDTIRETNSKLTLEDIRNQDNA